MLATLDSSCPDHGPNAARVLRTLKDGYWDHTEVIELSDGERRVRKRTKGANAPGPWAVRSLRREIAYFSTLSAAARDVFPRLLRSWDRVTNGAPDVGYEIPFFPEHQDAGQLARGGLLDQAEIDDFQDQLADAVLHRLQVAERPDEPLSRHLADAVRESLDALRQDGLLAPLIDANGVRLNGEDSLGPSAAFSHIQEATGLLEALDGAPSVRLHGDFFLENILWRPGVARGNSRLILIDPVSVAGVYAGPPVFDLVKFESYAKGELPGLRSAWVNVAGFENPPQHDYRYGIRWEEPGLQPFLNRDWRSRYRRAFEAKFGEVDQRMYRLIDGYFSLAMAVNTSGVQRRARLLKATAEFNAVIHGG